MAIVMVIILAAALGLHSQPPAPALAGQQASVAYLALDAVNQGGNTKNSLDSGEPPFDSCVDVSGGSTFTIDLVADSIPSIPDADDPAKPGSAYGVTAVQILTQYDGTKLTRGPIDSRESLLGVNAGSIASPIESSLEAGTNPVDLLGIVDISTSPSSSEDNISGLVFRIPFTVKPGATGFAHINVLPAFGPFESNVTAGSGLERLDIPVGNLPGGANDGKFLSVTAAIGRACAEAPPPLTLPEIEETSQTSPIVAGATATAAAVETAVASSGQEPSGEETPNDGEGTADAATAGPDGASPSDSAEAGSDGDGTSTAAIVAYAVAGVAAALAALGAAGWIIRRRGRV